MKIVNIIVAVLLSTLSLNATDDCIMVQELSVEFKNDSTAYVNNEQEMLKIKEFKDFVTQTNLFVLIEGHTNKIFSADHNIELSTKRAVKVMNKLISLGLKKSQVRAMGFGESSPLYDNNTEDGLAKNRRVIAEVFNSANDLNQYVQDQQA